MLIIIPKFVKIDRFIYKEYYCIAEELTHLFMPYNIFLRRTLSNNNQPTYLLTF